MASPKSLTLLLVAVLTGGAGFGLARWTGRAPKPAGSAAAGDDRGDVRSNALDTAQAARAGGLAGDLTLVRQIVREELASAMAAHPAATPAVDKAAADDVRPAPAPEHVPKLEQAHATVTAALARGTWSAQDRDNLRAILNQLPPELETEVLQPLIIATNQDKLKVSPFEGAPF